MDGRPTTYSLNFFRELSGCEVYVNSPYGQIVGPGRFDESDEMKKFYVGETKVPLCSIKVIRGRTIELLGEVRLHEL
jgi:hypothetical protein